MIDSIINFFEKKKKTKVEDLCISVKEKEQFLSLDKYFRQKMYDYIDKNMICLDW